MFEKFWRVGEARFILVLFGVLVATGLLRPGRADDGPEADENEKTAAVVKKVVEAIGGADKQLRLFQFKESLNLSADPRAERFERVSVVEPPDHWWVGTKDRVREEMEPATFLVWAWTLGALTDDNSKLEILPDIEDGDKMAFGLRVSGTIDPPMDVYFEAKEARLLRIDWRTDIVRFSEWKELDGLHYPSRAIGHKKADGKAWYHSDIVDLTRLTELPPGLSR